MYPWCTPPPLIFTGETLPEVSVSVEKQKASHDQFYTHNRHIQQQHTNTHTGVICTSGGNADAPRGSDTAGRPVHWWTAIASNSSPVITSYFEIEYKCNWMIR